MPSIKPPRLATICALLATAILLPACQTTSTGTDVTLQSIQFVCLSRKDTDGTKRQVAENNAALLALGAKQRKCK